MPIVNRIFAASFSVLLLCSCEIDNGAALAEYDFGSFAEIVCSDAEFQQSQYDKFFYKIPDEKRIPIEQRLQKTKTQCSILDPIRDNSQATYDELKNGIYSPREVFLFHLLVKVGDDTQTRIVGFFDSENSCNDTRKKLEAVDYETNPCYSRTLFWKVAWA